MFVTTGDVPTRLSDPAASVFRRDPFPMSGVGHTDPFAFAGLHFHTDGRVYATTVPGGGQYAYDTLLDEWTFLTTRVAGVTTWALPENSKFYTLMGTATNSNDVVRFSDTNEFTDDNGTAISTRTYQTVFWDLGLPGEKVVREVEIWGGGTVDVTLYSDYVVTGGTSSSVNLGAGDSATLSTRGFHRVAVKGTYFALKISASAYFRIDRIIFHLREAKNVGAKSS